MKYTAKHLIVYILLSFCGCAVLSAQSKTKRFVYMAPFTTG